jgi:hypothetical protein
VREVGAGQLERLGSLCLVLVDLAGVLVVASALEFFETVLVRVLVGLPGRVVIGRHGPFRVVGVGVITAYAVRLEGMCTTPYKGQPIRLPSWLHSRRTDDVHPLDARAL